MEDPKLTFSVLNSLNRINQNLQQGVEIEKEEDLWKQEIREVYKQTGTIKPSLILKPIDNYYSYTEKEFVSGSEKKGDGHFKPKSGFTKKLYNFAPNVVPSPEVYSSILALFELSESNTISDKQGLELERHHSTLEARLEAQIEEIKKYDYSIIMILSEYYKKCELAHQKKSSNYKSGKIPKDWFNFISNLRAFFLHIQQNLQAPQLSDDDKAATCFNAVYLDKESRNEYAEKIQSILQQRNPVVETAKNILRKVYSLQSLLEDYYSNKPIKYFDIVKRDAKYQTMPNPMLVGREYVETENRSGPNVSFSVQQAQQALTIYRRLIVDRNITTMNRKERPIAEEILEELRKSPTYKSLGKDYRKWNKLIMYYWNLYNKGL